MSFSQEEEFDEDEGIYDELNLDEEEEKFGLANDEDSDESEDASDGMPACVYICNCDVNTVIADLPPRTPLKKQQHDEESVTSNKRDGSPVMKKATVTLQLRSPCLMTFSVSEIDFFAVRRAFNSVRKYGSSH